MSILSLAAGALSSYPFGVMSDHMGGGRKTLICVSCAGMALCFGILAFLSELNHVLIFAVLWGAFNGIFYSVDYAIALDTLPNKLEAARFLGIWGVSSFVGTTLGPVVGGTVLIVFGQWLEPGLPLYIYIYVCMSLLLSCLLSLSLSLFICFLSLKEFKW